jgi:glutamine synthetase
VGASPRSASPDLALPDNRGRQSTKGYPSSGGVVRRRTQERQLPFWSKTSISTYCSPTSTYRMGFFGMDQVESYMELKWEEVYAFEHTPHPIEFQMYYSV